MQITRVTMVCRWNEEFTANCMQFLEIAVLIKKHICWKVKIRTESNRGKKCMFDCNVTKFDVRQSDYHFADRDKLYEAPNQRFGRQFNVPTHIELLVCSSLSLKTRWVCKKKNNFDFLILIAKIWTPRYCSPRVPKRPRTFVCCEVLRPSQHY